MKRVYIAGPMTGMPEHNLPAFVAATAALEERGFEIVSPHQIYKPANIFEECLKLDIREMLTCDGIVVIDGWEASRGARMETSVAIQLGMPVIRYEEAMQNGPI